MSFRDFLLEMPHWNVPVMKVKCPKGDIIDGSDSDYHYDMAYEFIMYKELKNKLMNAQSLFKTKYTGILPFYCNKHDVLFLYDFDKNESVDSSEDRDLLDIVRTAMKKHPNYKNKKIKIA